MKYLFIFGLFVLPAVSLAAVQKLAPNGGEVNIVAKGHPNFLRVLGKGSPATGELNVDGEKVSGRFEFDLTSLETGIETRDRHMKERYLEVEKFPTAVLVIQKAGNLSAWNIKNPVLDDDSFEGVLTLHGVTKPVTGKFTVNAERAVKANFTVKLSDFGVAVPRFGGITIADDVDVSVKIENLNTL